MTQHPEHVMKYALEVAREWDRIDWNSYEGDFVADLADDIAAALAAAEERGRSEERERCAAPTEEARKRFELWFFRDMNDEQRMKLFSLFGLPACGIKTLGAQQQVLRSVFSLIIGPNARDPFLIVADWHDKQARTFKDMSQDIRSGELGRAKANEASKHHAGSAAALRLHSLNSKRAAITKEPTP